MKEQQQKDASSEATSSKKAAEKENEGDDDDEDDDDDSDGDIMPSWGAVRESEKVNKDADATAQIESETMPEPTSSDEDDGGEQVDKSVDTTITEEPEAIDTDAATAARKALISDMMNTEAKVAEKSQEEEAAYEADTVDMPSTKYGGYKVNTLDTASAVDTDIDTKIKALEDDLAAALNEVQQSRGEIEEYKMALGAAKAKITELEKATEASASASSSSEKQKLKVAKKKIEELEAALKGLEEVATEQKSIIDQQKKVSSAFEKKGEVLEASNKALKEQLTSLKSQLSAVYAADADAAPPSSKRSSKKKGAAPAPAPTAAPTAAAAAAADDDQDSSVDDDDDDDDSNDEDLMPSWGSSSKRDAPGSLTNSGKMGRMEELLAGDHRYGHGHVSRGRFSSKKIGGGGLPLPPPASGRYRAQKKPPVPRFSQKGVPPAPADGDGEDCSSGDDDDDGDDGGDDDGGDDSNLPSWAEIRQSEKYRASQKKTVGSGSSSSKREKVAATPPPPGPGPGHRIESPSVLASARSAGKGYYLSAGVALARRERSLTPTTNTSHHRDGRGSPHFYGSPGVGPYSFVNHPTREMIKSPYHSPYHYQREKEGHAGAGRRGGASMMRRGSPSPRSIAYASTPPRPPLPSDKGVGVGVGVGAGAGAGRSGSPAWRPGGGMGGVSLSQAAGGVVIRGTPGSVTRSGANNNTGGVKFGSTPSSKRQIGGKFSPRRPFHLPRTKGSPVCTFGSGH